MVSVMVASAVNSDNRMSQVHNAEGLCHVCASMSVPKANPRYPLPTSPRKMRAGGQLRTRKPAVAAARTAEARASPRQPLSMSRRAPVPATKVPSAAAIPSMPSMKLVKLIIQTRPTTAKQSPTKPQLPRPNPQSNGGIPPRQKTTQPAATKWMQSRSAGGAPKRSSQTPMVATRVPPPTKAAHKARSSTEVAPPDKEDVAPFLKVAALLE